MPDGEFAIGDRVVLRSETYGRGRGEGTIVGVTPSDRGTAYRVLWDGYKTWTSEGAGWIEPVRPREEAPDE